MSLAQITQNAAVPRYVGRGGVSDASSVSVQWWELTLPYFTVPDICAGRLFILEMGLTLEHSQNEVEGVTQPMPSPTPRFCDWGRRGL